jgi:Spy/CpxP family protein refolding chaperone
VRTWKPILAALIIFLAGAVIGALIPAQGPAMIPTKDRRPPHEERSHRGGPPSRPPWNPTLSGEQIQEICGRMTRDLDLTPVQSNHVHEIVQEGQVRMKAIADEFLPRTREEFRRTREEIKAVLTPEQLETFEEDWRVRESRWRGRTNMSGGDRPFRAPEGDRSGRRGPEDPPPPRP